MSLELFEKQICLKNDPIVRFKEIFWLRHSGEGRKP